MGQVLLSRMERLIIRPGANICLCFVFGPFLEGISMQRNRQPPLKFLIVWLKWRFTPLTLWYWRVVLWTEKFTFGTFHKRNLKSLWVKLMSTSIEKPSQNSYGWGKKVLQRWLWVSVSSLRQLTEKYWSGVIKTNSGTRSKVTYWTQRREPRAQ